MATLTTLEAEVIEKFFQLDTSARQRVLSIIEQESKDTPTETLSLAEWLEEATALREKIAAAHGYSEENPIGIVQIIDEIRDEEL